MECLTIKSHGEPGVIIFMIRIKLTFFCLIVTLYYFQPTMEITVLYFSITSTINIHVYAISRERYAFQDSTIIRRRGRGIYKAR